MSPTVFRYKNFRFFFFSREESRMHIHVSCPEGEAKFWIEPVVALAQYQDISPKTLKTIHEIIEDRKNEIIKAWKKHFGS
ncbi:MAG: DUF4160 domain-containing protein [Deltaproteobacteria bacterium]|nr:DUF4160 domain-containing protein [Deltaproteobacteria bacterium]